MELTSIQTNSELCFMYWAYQEWERSEKYVQCLECGKEVPFAPIHMAHMLGKGAYPYLRLVLQNLIPLCAKCHRDYDSDLRANMMIGTWSKNKEDELKYYAETRRPIVIKKIDALHEASLQALIGRSAKKYIDIMGDGEDENIRDESAGIVKNP